MERDEMEKNVGNWVDDRLAVLGQPAAWRPNVIGGLARLRDRRDAVRVHRQRWVWAAAGLAVASGGLMAFPSTRALAGRCVDACVAESSRLFWPSSAAIPHDRVVAPDFTLADVSGAKVRLSDFKGSLVLLNFWATWCPPCLIEVPWFVEFQRTYRDRGLVVLGVAVDEDGWNSVKPFIDARRLNYRVMIGGDDIANLYGGLESLPTTLLIDKSGRIAAVHNGLIGKASMEAEIQTMLASK